MATDIRLDVDFFSHPKTRKIQRRCGDAGVLCILRLWTWVGKSRPNGKLEGLDVESIELAADWLGPPGEWVTAMHEVKFLDQDEDGVYSIHDWETRNGWVSRSTERGDAARFSRLATAAPEAWARLAAEGRKSITAEEYAAIMRARESGIVTTPSGDRRRTADESSTNRHESSRRDKNVTTNRDDPVTPSPSPSPSPAPDSRNNSDLEGEGRKEGALNIWEEEKRRGAARAVTIYRNWAGGGSMDDPEWVRSIADETGLDPAILFTEAIAWVEEKKVPVKNHKAFLLGWMRKNKAS